MAKRKPAKAKPPTKTVAKLVRGGMSVADARLIDSTATTEAINQHEHFVVNLSMIETVHGKEIKSHETKGVKRASTPILRWEQSKKLDSRQMDAIGIYEKACHVVYKYPSVVANWNAVVSGGGGGRSEEDVAKIIKAKKLLDLMTRFVFQPLGIAHTRIFHNIVIYDEAANLAGNRAGFVHKPAEAVALFAVQTVASMIATIFIDGKWPEYDAADLKQIGRAA